MSHPKGLYLLFVTEMAERFSYYGMRALFVLYLVAAFFTNDEASQIYGSYTGLVYLTPLLGGYIADRYWGNRRSIIFGGISTARAASHNAASTADGTATSLSATTPHARTLRATDEKSASAR